MKTITKRDYFKDCLNEKLYKDKTWLIRTLGVIRTLDVPDESPAYIPSEKKVIYHIGGDPIHITDAVIDKPLFDIDEEVKVNTDFLPNIKSLITTTYRTVILNAIIITEPFSGTKPFLPWPITGKILDKMIEEGLRDKSITVPQYMEFTKATGFITFLTNFSVPTASPQVIRPSVAVKKLKDRLVKENADKLDDPVVVAEIDRQITELLRKEMEGDSSEGFFIKDKSFNTVRKMTHGMIGGVPRLDDDSKVETITRSLEEGWEAKDIPAIVNNLRSGSYDRGKDTQLGGESAKLSGRVYQNTKIKDGDCGSNVGVPTYLNKDTYKYYIGRYLVDSPTKPLTEADLESKIGKTISIRSPVTCKTKAGNFCEICMGKVVSEAKVSPGPLLSAVGSVFLSISLSAFHGKQLRTVKYDHTELIS